MVPNCETSPGAPRAGGTALAISVLVPKAIADRIKPTRTTAAGRISPSRLNIIRFMNTISSLSLSVYLTWYEYLT